MTTWPLGPFPPSLLNRFIHAPLRQARLLMVHRLLDSKTLYGCQEVRVVKRGSRSEMFLIGWGIFLGYGGPGMDMEVDLSLDMSGRITGVEG